jgi:hypothetical protein
VFFLLALTTVVACCLAVYQTCLVSVPKTFHSLPVIVERHASNGWQIDVAPEVQGPFREVSSRSIGAHKDPKVRFKGQYVLGEKRAKIDVPVGDGRCYKIIHLETADSDPAILVLARETKGIAPRSLAKGEDDNESK